MTSSDLPAAGLLPASEHQIPQLCRAVIASTIRTAIERYDFFHPGALRWSRGVLRDFGNMSSATLIFVLERMMCSASADSNGVAIAFGPGLVAETFRFRLIP
jgi:predicted naringenin-chalcone synthase